MSKFYPDGVGIMFWPVLGQVMPFPVCDLCKAPIRIINGVGYFSCQCHPEQLQICGHPLGAIAQSNDGTAYCSACAWGSLSVEERLMNLG